MPNASPLGQGSTTDWFAEALQARIPSGGTFETVSGQDPRMRKVMDSPNPPGVMESAALGTIENPAKQVERLARQRFPNLPLRDAMDRYGRLDGEIVYLGDDGSIYREFPSWSASSIARGAAEFVPAALGGMYGGSKGGPWGAAAGAAVGLAARKAAGTALGDERTFGEDAFDLAGEAALNALGWKIGDLFGKKVIDRRVASDLGKFDRAKAIKLQKISKDYFGIDLTPAESAELGSLINQQVSLGTGLDDAASVLRDFYERRAGQVAGAVDDFIGKPPHAAKAGASLRGVFKQNIDDAVAAREAASGPLYKALDRANPMIDERAFMALEEDDLIRGYIDKAVSDPTYGVMDTPRNSYRVVDRAGKLMRDESEAAKRAGRNFEASRIEQARTRLLGKMEEVVPGYKDARRAFARGSEYVDELKGGVEGVIANLKDTKLTKAVNIIFDSRQSNPQQVANARRLFESQGKAKEWDDVLNLWLKQKWEGIRSPMSGTDWSKGAKWRQAVYGSDAMRNNMKAAMGPARFERFEALMETLEATAKVPKGQSQTAGVLAARTAEQAEASPIGSMAKVDIADPLSSFNLREWWVDAKTRNWRADLAEIITSPDAIESLEKLRKLRAMSPGDRRALSLASTAVAKALGYAAAGVARPDIDQAPPALNRPAPDSPAATRRPPQIGTGAGRSDLEN